MVPSIGNFVAGLVGVFALSVGMGVGMGVLIEVLIGSNHVMLLAGFGGFMAGGVAGEAVPMYLRKRREFAARRVTREATVWYCWSGTTVIAEFDSLAAAREYAKAFGCWISSGPKEGVR